MKFDGHAMCAQGIRIAQRTCDSDYPLFLQEEGSLYLKGVSRTLLTIYKSVGSAVPRNVFKIDARDRNKLRMYYVA